jgi:hypothetical protein
MSDPLIILISLCAFFIVFPLFWTSIIGLIAFSGGWRKLAQAYPVEDTSATKWKHNCTARLGGPFSIGLYRSSLSVGKDTTHLHLQPMIFFRPYHPTISVPLSDISPDQSGTGLLLTSKLSFRNSDVPLSINSKLSDWIMG